jgi:signal transduction histidine kinase
MTPGAPGRRGPVRRSIRLRLTMTYAAMFLASGVVLLTITYLVVVHQAPGAALLAVRGGTGTGTGTGAAAGPSGPASLGPAVAGASGTCLSTGASPQQLGECVTYLRAEVATQRTGYLNTLLAGSGVALGVMTLAALGLGWMSAGRALGPLRTITLAARSISASNLHERLALSGPDDELKELGDTVDGLLARLEGSFAAQRQFVANASHELRTPLARQRTLVEVALADPGRSIASLEAACGRVLAAGQQQERLIEALLTLARSQRGLDHYERVDLAALTREVALSRAAEADQRGVCLTVRADQFAAFCGDAGLAERLIANLLDNAIRHNQAGGRVTVTAFAEAGQATLLVANTGPVIRPADVPGLFAPFRRGWQQRTGAGDTPGLGLSIVGTIAAAHGAALLALPRDGGGLDVRVTFPARPAYARPLTIRPSMPSERAG